MPTALPPAVNFTGASVTEGQFKTAITDLREHVNEMSILKSLAANGYMQFSSGLIIQWTSVTTGAIAAGKNASAFSATLPIAFPTACRKAIAVIEGLAVSAGNYATTDGITWSTTAVAGNIYSSAAQSAINVTVFAIGH